MNDPIHASFRSYAAVIAMVVSSALAYKGYAVADVDITELLLAAGVFVSAVLSFISKVREGKKNG